MGIMDKFKKEEKKAKKPKAAAKKEKVEKAETSVPAEKKPATGAALKVIIRPVVTEKSAVMQTSQTYAFVVANSAKKPQIAEAVKEIYGVTPVSIRVMNVQGHRVRFGKNTGKRSDFKKAMVTLKPGDSITIHEGV